MRLRDKFEWHFESYKTLFFKSTSFFVGARALDKSLCDSVLSRGDASFHKPECRLGEVDFIENFVCTTGKLSNNLFE